MSTRSSDSVPPFERRPLAVLALGGNALSPPALTDGEGYDLEREIIASTKVVIDRIIAGGHRLLVVHGNGPQVGRLLRADPEPGNLDIHVAQTQGELGYLLLGEAMVCVVTRVLVTEPLGAAVKPIGPLLERRPSGVPAVRLPGGWRVTVPSPRPARVLEQAAIARLLCEQHVIAGGGGGVALDAAGRPLSCVVDKDWVASLLAIALGAERLVFATDVEGVYEHVSETARPIERITVSGARRMVDSGTASAGSMAPKLASAADYVAATGRAAVICGLAAVHDAVARGTGGTVVAAD